MGIVEHAGVFGRHGVKVHPRRIEMDSQSKPGRVAAVCRFVLNRYPDGLVGWDWKCDVRLGRVNQLLGWFDQQILIDEIENNAC